MAHVARKHRSHRPRVSDHAPLEQRIAQWLLIGLLAFMPLAFGAVQEWSRFVLLTGTIGLLACLVVSAWRRRNAGGLVWSAAYIPLALFIFMALLQALPAPFGAIEWLSPQAANLYQDLRQEVLSSFTFSLYPRATWHDLCVVVFAAVFFLTVVSFFRRGTHVKRLLLSVACIGAFFAILALLQGALSNGRIYWIGPAEVQANSGTFACHNHFSQHMVLSVMAMIAYAMVRTREVIGRTWLDKESFADWIASRELRGVRWLLLMAVLGLVAVTMSVSRMGTVSAAVALCAVVLMYASRRGAKHANLPMLVGISALIVVVFVGFEMVFERMATLKDFDAYENRWVVVKDTISAIGDFALVGSGLGTFSVVYPMYDTGYTWRFSSHAENEYVQLLLEMGVVGFAVAAWFVFIVGRSAFSTMTRMNRPLYVAGPPLAAGLLAVMLHSWTDFGQHLPAIAGLSAVFCGLLVVMGHRATVGKRRRPAAVAAPVEGAANRSNVRRQIYLNALLGILAMVLVLNAPAGFLRVFAEEYDTAALDLSDRLSEAKWHAPDADYATLVSLGERAVQLDPGNVFYRYRLGVYRWWAVVRDRKAEELSGAYADEVVQTASQIVDEMISALASCPTMGSLHSWRGQLEWWVLGDAAGRERVERAARLARNDRVTQHAAGVLAAVENEPELAYERFRRALEVRGDMSAAAVVLLEESKRPDLALALAGADPLRLHEISSLLARKGYADEAADARRRSLDTYRTRVEDPSTPPWAIATLAESSAKDGDVVEAVALYRRALAREYTQTNWRAAEIRCLIASGDLAEAERETAVLQRLNAQLSLIDALRTEISKARRVAATQAAGQSDPAEEVQ